MRRLALLVTVLLAAAVAPFPGVPASASCVAPSLSIVGHRASAPAVAPGTEVTVAGRWFVEGCDDTGTTRTGPFGCDDEPVRSEERPMRGVELVLRQRGREWPLGTADATRRGEMTWEVRIPDGLRPGRARLVAGSSEALRLVIPAR